MASILNADNGVVSGSAGLKSNADSSGVLELQTNGTTAVTVNTNQSVSLTAGTANGVTYLNGSKVLTSGSTLVFDGSNLSVGATPQTWTNGRALELTGLNFSTVVVNSASSNAAARNWMMASNWNAFGDLCFVQGSSIGVKPDTIRMQLDPSGNMGLGVTPSAWVAAVKGLQINTYGAIGASTANMNMYGNLFSSSSGTAYLGNGYGNLLQMASGQFVFYQAGNNVSGAGAAATITQAMTLDASGNLLVGTTTTITGVVGTFQNSSNTFRNFVVSNTVATGNSGTINSILGANGSSTSSYHFVGNTATIDKIYIYGNGNIVNVNNSYGSLSDVKLKENIVDTSPKLADLLQVKVRNYNLIGETTKQLGVVAQELETVFPAMVDESPDRDAEGNDLGTTTKSVKYSVFVPMLIKAIQEQQALITTLTDRISVLENK